MAIQQLTQPILNPIAAFDGMTSQTISFIVIGGAQVIGNRLIISDNQTGRQIYNNTQSTMKLEHTIPAGTLSNGRYYNAVIYTIDSSGTQSMASVAVPFYCYSQPTLTIDNIPSSETIENGTYQFTGSYLQSEGEALNSYQFTLYDSNKNILSQTPLIYYETDDSLSYTFVGMSNDTSYYVSLTGETINNTKITSGLKYFTVRYLQPASFAICDLVNDCDNGFIQISSNIVAIDGKSNPEPPIYIDDKEVDLRDPDSWVRWDEGFSIKNDFTMRVWGRDFNPYENIITLSNNLNSTGNPNKIEMKWMIGETIKNLPQYKNAEGKNVNLKDSKTGELKNLMVGGSTVQEVREEIYYGKDTSITIVDEEKVSADGRTKRIPHEEVVITNIYGNQYQFMQEGSSQEIEGENIHLEDVDSSKPADLFIKGNNYQETRSGSNLLDLNVSQNREVTVNDDGTVTINGSGGYFLNFKEITLKKGVKYYQKYQVISGTATNSKEEGKIFFNLNRQGYLKEGVFSEATFQEDTAKRGFWIHADATFDNAKIKIWANTDESDFEQYGVSPSPGYPSEIKTVGSNINLFDKDKALQGYELNGTTGQTSTNNLFFTSDYIRVNPNGQYFLSGKHDGTSNCFYDKNKKYLAKVTLTNGLLTVPSNSDIYYLRFNAGLTSIDTTMIVKGTIATPYSSYNQGSAEVKISNNDNTQSQSIVMPIQQEMLEGDYIADVEHHEWTKLIFTGDEDISLENSYQGIYQFGFANNAKWENDDKIRVISNYYKGVMYNNSWAIDNCTTPIGGGKVGIMTSQYTTVDSFKTFLKSKYDEGNPVIVYYKLATPVSLALTSGQKTAQSQLTNMTLYQNVTDISNKGSYPAIMNLNYNIVRETPSSYKPSEIKTVGNNINLFDKNNVANGYRIAGDGSLYSDKSCFTSQYIEVQGNTQLVKNTDINAYQAIAFYDENKKFISRNTTLNPCITPENTYYVRVCDKLEELDTLKLEKGSVTTPYSPYGMGSVETDVVNKNLYNGKTEIGGINNDGSLNNNVDRWRAIDYINVENSTDISINIYNITTTGALGRYCLYDKNYNFLSSTQIININTVVNVSNVSYFKFWFLNDKVPSNTKIQVETGSTPTAYVQHQFQSVIMPIQQEMLEGDYIKDVEHHEWKKLVLTGDEDVSQDDIYQGIAQYSIPADGIFINDLNIRAISNCFKGVYWNNSWEINNSVTINDSRRIRFMTSQYTTVDSFKAFLKSKYDEGNPVIVYYKLAEPVNLELTEEQRAAKNMLYNWKTYIPITHINTDSDFPILESFTPKIPSLFNESVLYSLGQHKNLINIPNFVINYSQGYGTATKTDLVLRKNSTYTLSFEYNITNETTDAYYSIGYGVDAYEHDLNANIIYTNSTTGTNVFTLTTPENLPENNFLWIKFGHTIILADLTVEIMNVQLEYGEKATDYQSPNLYNIYPTISNKNLYDFRNYVYTIKNNAVVQVTNNGYNIQVKTIGEESSLAVGFMNILNPGETYAISFQTLGGFSGYKLYTTEKNSQIPLSEIIINDGIFVAPEGVYDLQLVFLINSDGTNNSTDIWNIQIEQNNQVTEYETHESNKSQVVIGEPLRGIEEYRDLIFSTSPNILNPQTKSAAVEGNKDYYLNQKGNTLYYVWYYNKEGNLITFIDEEGKEASGAILTRGIFTTHEDCVRITINKNATPQVDDLSEEEILNNNVMISEYSSFSAYYPYLQEPSEIRYIKKIELTGDENLILATGQRFQISLQDNNYPVALDTDDEINAVSNYFTGVNSSVDNVDYSVSANGNSLYLKFADNSSGNDVRKEIKSRYDKGEPVQIFYKMKNSVINSLSSDNNESLQKLVAYEPISNVFTDNLVLGMLNFSYINSMTEQQTENAYVQLKCYNMNKLPYYVHSNYIDIPDDTDKVFIWVRRKNNLFDLKIENLGDYSGDKPGDKNKPIVSLDIDLIKVTSTQIPVIANAVDETGLKTIRFSKDNGETWEEVIAIDGLSTTKSYVFENLIPGTTYTIRVEAIDVSGNIGGISQNVTTKET